jgi:hypothetical protein
VVLRFVKCLGASDSVTIDIGLAHSVESRGGGQMGLALRVLHCIGRRLVMKLPGNGLWGGGAALRAGCCVPDLSPKPCDLHGARPAMRGTAAPEHGSTGRSDEEAHISAPPDGLTRYIWRVESCAYQMARVAHVGLLAAPKEWLGGQPQSRLQIAWLYSRRSHHLGKWRVGTETDCRRSLGAHEHAHQFVRHGLYLLIVLSRLRDGLLGELPHVRGELNR